jgi:hypothetical protein
MFIVNFMGWIINSKNMKRFSRKGEPLLYDALNKKIHLRNIIDYSMIAFKRISWANEEINLEEFHNFLGRNITGNRYSKVSTMA